MGREQRIFLRIFFILSIFLSYFLFYLFSLFFSFILFFIFVCQQNRKDFACIMLSAGNRFKARIRIVNATFNNSLLNKTTREYENLKTDLQTQVSTPTNTVKFTTACMHLQYNMIVMRSVV